jgi:hypothetical protein
MLVAVLGLLGLGVLHGLGPDHLAALATLAVRGGTLRQAVGTAIRFGVGHAGLLAAGAALVLGLGATVPEAFERAAEIGGGAIVALLGLAAIVEAAGLRVHRHSHEHGDGLHRHLHAHVGREHLHGARLPAHGAPGNGHAWAIGAALAVSGLRGMLLLLPAAGAGSPLFAALGVAAFGAGVILSMIGASVAGVLAAGATGFGVRHGARAARGLIGAASFGIGVFWIFAAW